MTKIVPNLRKSASMSTVADTHRSSRSDALQDRNILMRSGSPSTIQRSMGSSQVSHSSLSPTQHPPRSFCDRMRANRLEYPFTVDHPLSSTLPSRNNTSHTPPTRCHVDSPSAALIEVEKYAEPFINFITENPTVYHTVAAFSKELDHHGFTKLSEREHWKLKKGGKYYVGRNGTSLIAFVVGDDYVPGNGAAVVAGHIDALTTKLKAMPKVPSSGGFLRLGVAPYAGALNDTWWDRDLGIAGKVLVKEDSGKIVEKLVKVDWPIARIPTLAPHFGSIARGPFNIETQMVPIVALEGPSTSAVESTAAPIQGGEGTFAATQPDLLVKVISKSLGLSDCSKIINWELELFDTQPACLGGLNKDFIFAGRVDDKICSWAALQALLNDTKSASSRKPSSSIIKIGAYFDNEEIGSLLRQGARGNFLPATLERAIDSLAASSSSTQSSSQGTASLLAQTFANSFLVSSDVTHAVNPNFPAAHLPNASPYLNVGVALKADSSGHTTTDAVSAALIQRCCEQAGAKLQVEQTRNDVRSGGTIGPMLSASTGMRAVDCGIPQLSMHSIRATVGSRDPGLGVQCYQAFYENYEKVDAEFR